jgi:hypothetical protein
VLVQATSHNVRAYSLRDAEDFNETSVDYEHFAACASLPSSSLVKERGDFRLRPVMKQRSTREGRAYTAAQRRGQSLSLKPRPRLRFQNPPPFSGGRFLQVLANRVNRFLPVSFRSKPPPLLTAASQPEGLQRKRGFYRAKSTASTTFFSSISTTSAAFLKPVRLAAEGGFYRP